MGGYNVTYYAPTCTVASKPWFCNNHNSTVACVRGGVGTGGGQLQIYPFQELVQQYAPLTAAAMLLCLCIVCIRVYMKDRKMDILLRNWSAENGNGDSSGNRNSSKV